MSGDPDKFTNITLLLRLSILLNQDRPTYQSRIEVDRSDEPFAFAGILAVKDEVIATYTAESATVVVAAQSTIDLDAPLYMAPLGRTHYPPHVVVNPNPKGHRDAKGNSNPHQLRLLKVDDATDFWPQVQSNEWCCANTAVTLEQHAKTVTSYLNDYKHFPDHRVKHARSFYSYLVTVCWEKIFSRVSSWSAVGLIYGLRAVLRSGGVDTAINRFPWTSLDGQRRPGDRTLARTLKDASAEAIPVMMATLDDEYRPVDELTLAAETALAENGNYRFYTKSTARQFHCLLLAAFIKFAKVLNEMNDAKRRKAGAEELVVLLRSFAIWARILTCTLASPTFEDHLRVLAHSNKLSIVVPMFDFREMYESFAVQQGIHINLKLGPSDYQVEDDLDMSKGYPNPEKIIALLLRCVKIFVVHFLAKRSLEAHFIRFPVQESFVVVVDRSRCIIPPSWPDMETIITEAMSSLAGEGPSVQRTIAMLKDKITMGTPGDDAKGKMVQFFQDVIGRRVINVPAGFHSQILLATLSLGRHEEITHGTNDKLLQDLCGSIHKSPSLISVSKPCCPVCQVFFQVLTDESSAAEPMVRGSQSNLSPVQLPVWTPPTIRDKMERIFLDYLRDELVDMVTPPSPTPPLASMQGRQSNMCHLAVSRSSA